MTIDFEAQHTKYSLSHPADSLLAIGRVGLRAALVLSPLTSHLSPLTSQLPSRSFCLDSCNDRSSYTATRECDRTLFSNSIAARHRRLLAALGGLSGSPYLGVSDLSEPIQPACVHCHAHRSCDCGNMDDGISLPFPFHHSLFSKRKPVELASHRLLAFRLYSFYHFTTKPACTLIPACGKYQTAVSYRWVVSS